MQNTSLIIFDIDFHIEMIVFWIYWVKYIMLLKLFLPVFFFFSFVFLVCLLDNLKYTCGSHSISIGQRGPALSIPCANHFICKLSLNLYSNLMRELWLLLIYWQGPSFRDVRELAIITKWEDCIQSRLVSFQRPSSFQDVSLLPWSIADTCELEQE